MKQAITGLIVVALFIAGGWAAMQIFGDDNFYRRHISGPSDAPVINVPRRLPAIEKAQLEIELSLVEADFAAQKVARSRLPQNRNIKIDR